MNFIYKLGVLLALMLGSLLGNAQSKSDKLYTLFEGKDGFTVIGFSKSVMKPFDIFLDNESKRVLYKMERVKFMSYNDWNGKLSAEDVYNRISKTLNSGSYFEIDATNLSGKNASVSWDKDTEDIRIIGHGTPEHMDEFHIVTLENNRTFFISFYGKIDIEDIDGFTSMNRSIGNFSFKVKTTH
jgi:hypothetical protein